MGHSKKFNPFNLDSTELESDSRIKFRRLGRKSKTRPLWWLIAFFIIIVFVFMYLRG
jgi:hypothetical protein